MDTDRSIGALARETGVKVPTIRFYETIGLLPEPGRTASNRRLYGKDAVRRLHFIRHARELGFEIPTIRQLLSLADDPKRACDEVDAIARKHVSHIESRIERLTALRGALNRMLRQCARGRISDCRIIEALGSEGDPKRGH